MKAICKEEALTYHELGGVPGKISVVSSKPLENQRDLSLAYTPGVAYPVLEIAENEDAAYRYTNKGNLVAVVTNGTAILGLGDRGALASKPVMEGKGVLFKKFSGIDVFDIEIDSHDPDRIIDVVCAIAPTFGGINLEDIRSPECFYIETELQKRLPIPIFHDDQHGTAIILAAAFLNALEIKQKKIDQVKVVFCGAGAAAIACARQLNQLGVPKSHVYLCDIAGLVYHGRKEEMFAEKAEFAQGNKPQTISQVIQGADVLIGLSVAGTISEEMINRMTANPIIFAMANPIPEIGFELVKEARPDAIMATGRSDYPNQINNVLGFPYIFRGALDVRASAINQAMKTAASCALASLARETVPAEVLKMYEIDHLEFGVDYFVPKALDPRVCAWESSAVAEAAVTSGVARKTIDLAAYRQRLDCIYFST